MKSIVDKKKIVVGVSGGIAAYKSAELLRLIVKSGAKVRVLMTQNAQKFVGPLTFEALSGQTVCADLFESDGDASIRHIDWARETDAVVIAPATANIIGKIAHGIADDALSTFVLAVTCPVIVCPSMNTHMYENRVVQRNIDRLKADGNYVVEPDSGELACGTTGPGRLPEPADIFDRLLYTLHPKDLANKKILVTAGPTREHIDPVRFISNPSSGKMGFAVARAAEYRGGEVCLVTGPTHLSDPNGVSVVRVQTAREMADEVLQRMNGSDIIVKTAAVSDYRPKDQVAYKIKKDEKEHVLILERNLDILKELGRRKDHQIVVGFAAETENLERNAAGKMAEKCLDMIAGNLIGKPDSGFEAEMNTVTLFYKDGSKESLPAMHKDDVAHTLLDRIAKMFDQISRPDIDRNTQRS